MVSVNFMSARNFYSSRFLYWFFEICLVDTSVPEVLQFGTLGQPFANLLVSADVFQLVFTKFLAVKSQILDVKHLNRQCWLNVSLACVQICLGYNRICHYQNNLSVPMCRETITNHLLHFNRPISQIPQCTCPISHNAPYRTEICTFLFWMGHCGIWDRCIVGFANLVYCHTASAVTTDS